MRSASVPQPFEYFNAFIVLLYYIFDINHAAVLKFTAISVYS